MKKQTFSALLMAAVVGFTAVSCEKELAVKQEPVETQDEILLPEGEGEFVLRDRDPEHPFVVKAPIDYGAIRTKAGQDISKHLGESFKLDDYPFASSHNLGHLRVLDYEKYIQDYPERYYEETLEDLVSRSMVFADFERYESKREKTENYSAGLDAGIWIFKIKAKDTYKKVFSESETSLEEHVYGEYFSQYQHKKYGLEIDKNFWGNQVFMNYVHPDFLSSLYNNSAKDFIEQYGSFFLKEYIAGAQVILLYEGTHKNNTTTSSTVKENHLEASINASIGSKYISSIGANGDVVNGSNANSSMQGKFTSIEVSARTIGGRYGINDFTIAKDLGATKYDFTSWYNSLTDPSRFVITAFDPGSLIPITAFVEEDNLKNSFNYYYKEGKFPPSAKTIEEPRIVFFISDNPNDYEVKRSLRTRFGEYINLGFDVVSVDSLDAFLRSEYIRLGTAFPHIQIVSNRSLGYGSSGYYSEPKAYVTIEITKSPNGGRSIKTYIGKFADDKILIRHAEENVYLTTAYVKEETSRIKTYYPGIKVKTEYLAGLPAGTYGHTSSLKIIEDKPLPSLQEVDNYYIRGEVIIPTSYSKFVDSTTGKTYILDEFQKIGYTLYDQDVMDCYSGGEFVRRIPDAKNITVKDIRRNYKLIAL